MALVAFAFLGLLAVILVVVSSVLLIKIYWRSGDESSTPSQQGCGFGSFASAAAASTPPAALSPPDDIEFLDRGALVVRLYALLTGNGPSRLRSLGSDGVFRTRSGTQITVFHSAEKLCIVVKTCGPGKVWRIALSFDELFVLFAFESLQPSSGGVGAIATSQARNTSTENMVNMPAESLRALLAELSVSYAVDYLE